MKKSTLRQQAEEKLGRQKSAATPETEADTLRLVHELQVHQIELEMQNEELAQARAEAEEAYRQYTDLYDFAPVGYFTLTQDGAISKVNLAGANLLGLRRVDLLKRRLGVFTSDDSRAIFNDFFDKLLTGEGKKNCELMFERKEDAPLWVWLEATCFEGGQECRVVAMDISQRKQAEESLSQQLVELETLHSVSATLRTAHSLEEALPNLLDETLASLGTDSGAILLHNQVTNELKDVVTRGWNRQMQEHPIRPWQGMAGTVFVGCKTHHSSDLPQDQLVLPEGWSGVCIPIRADEAGIGVLFVSVRLPRQITDGQVRLLESLGEIAGATIRRIRMHEEIIHRLEDLQALYDVDMSIASSFDLRTTLEAVIHHTLNRLKVDAADILLLVPHLNMLEYSTGQGFRTNIQKGTRVNMEESFAGRAVRGRHAIRVTDQFEMRKNPKIAAFWKSEGFTSCFCVPLIAKGEIKGVLEVYNRVSHPHRPEWEYYLETLAGQAAIAIHISQLFENLERANLELEIAYAATIQGWSSAIDLRDHETEDHSQRVAEMTAELAAHFNFNPSEIQALRRGALLHDIGNMGVPDVILFKPGPLTEEERVIMRRHPQSAYEMLKPIDYLHESLDIPYCHHEKWDGSGYPRGLAGENIPLAARIFAVVDVYEALTSKRPFRQAWTKGKALEYIKEQSGAHFDPKVVDAFLGKVVKR